MQDEDHFTICILQYYVADIPKRGVGGLPTRNLSNDTNVVLISKITEVGDDCCRNDLLKEDTPQFR